MKSAAVKSAITISSLNALLTNKGNYLVKILYLEEGKPNGCLIFYSSAAFVRLTDNELARAKAAKFKRNGFPFFLYEEWNKGKSKLKMPDVALSDEQKSKLQELAEKIIADPLFGFPLEEIKEVHEKSTKAKK